MPPDTIPAMSPVALYFASGESFYSGVALLVLTVAVSPFLQQHWLLRVRNGVAWLSLAMMVMACAPFAWVVDVIFLVAFAVWFIATNYRRPEPMWAALHAGSTIILLALLVILVGIELPHRTMPVIAGDRSDHLAVIGDSISSGIDPRVPPWPLVLQQISGASVRNLARPGALTSEGLTMVKQLTQEDHVVVIEIGGNDLLMGVPSADFERALESLLSKASAPARTVVMFELPLLPHKVAYGQIQRRLASKYNVALIPKHYFTDVIGDANATSDGLHLSTAGARRMAVVVAQVLAPALKPQPTAVSP
jgi:acyl-CoA thioesterase-1